MCGNKVTHQNCKKLMNVSLLRKLKIAANNIINNITIIIPKNKISNLLIFCFHRITILLVTKI